MNDAERALTERNVLSDMLERRFLDHIKIDSATDCWFYTKSKTNKRQSFYVPGVRGSVPAARASWIFRYKESPAPKLVFNTCDSHNCANPDHLKLRPRRGKRAKLEPEPGIGTTHTPNAKLTPEAVLDIRYAYDVLGESQSALAELYGVCVATIRSVVRGHTWRHVVEAQP